MITRTAQHFVEDLLTNGKNFRYILMVARNSQWKSRLDEVKQAFLSFSGKIAKKFEIF